MSYIFVTPQNVQGFKADNISAFAETNPPVETASNHPSYMTQSIPATMRRTAGRLLGVNTNNFGHSSQANSSSNDPSHLEEAFRMAKQRF